MERLQSVTGCKVMSFSECIKEFGWNLKDDGDCFKVTCGCGDSHIVYSGFIGTEVIECQGCGKRMTDLFSPIQTGNATCTILNPSDYEIEKDENGHYKYWIAGNKDGLILKESEDASCN